MLKCLTIFGLLLIVAPVGAEKPLPVKGGQQQQQPQSQADAAYPAAPQLCTSEVCKENAENAERYAYYKAHPKEYLKAAIAPANLSNWILAGLGTIGVLGAILTLVVIKRQVDLQGAAMQQWIEVGNWKSEGESTARGKGLRITVEIANPTTFPLTISHAQIRITSRRECGTNTWITGDYYLIPRSPLVVTFHFQIAGIEYDQEFQDGRMDFDVGGSLSYIDTLKNRKTQPVGGVLTCNSKRTHFTPHAGAMEPRDSDQPQYPN